MGNTARMVARAGTIAHTVATARVAALLLAVSLAGCVRPAAEPRISAPSGITDPSSQVARSSGGMVASASTLATAVGADVLARGGNAVDAAVATAFALAVTEPTMSGLGGRASMLIRTASGEVFGIDGLNQVPASFRDGAPAGYATSAIPGVPAALALAAERYGSWPLAELIAPAIRLAENGFPLGALEAERFASFAEELRTHEGSRRYFLKPNGTPYSPNELFIQRDLARTLRGIAEGGAQAFYTGWIADSIDADMVRKGGFVTRQELAGYRALPAIVVRGSYRGHEIVGNFTPASGHTVIQALQMMERFDMGRMTGASYPSVVGQAMQLALTDRSRTFGSPEESARRLTSKAYAAERGREISLAAPAAAPPDEPEPWWLRPDQDNTTHLSVVDRNMMTVALTQSLGPAMGSRLAAPGLGFLYATRLGSVPGSRPGSTIAPTVVMSPAGQPLYVLGGAGDARIISAVIQTLSSAIDQRLPLDRAVAAPRVHPLGQASLRVERGDSIGWSDAEMAALQAMGYEVSTSPSNYFGRVHAVQIGNGQLRFLGVAEPRGFGSASGPVR